ncbi:LysR substrate-binding domain-containing protein [Kiloniella laminariae]|uniref:LysR substrate-binding domain-containing protein n=1 Tax=Kiloniella laminariae TaxID=454162 RepID=UPI00036DA673|nr:LysR substrate-binding domain-containing protein [Kiloniella laminariae]
MKKRQLPNLNALRAFEAAARHLNFRVASEELNITHSAISHHIRNLEDQLSVNLFARTGRNVVLTESGKLYLPILSEAFDRIADGANLVQSLERPNTLIVQVYITVAMYWLLPRIHEFYRVSKGIQAQLGTSYLDWSFDRQGVDVGIIWTNKKDPDLVYLHLAEARLSPMCHVDLLKGKSPIKEPRDLLNHDILQLFNHNHDWSTWFAEAGIEDWAPDQAITYDNYLLALEAASKGRGVAMTNSPFATPRTPASSLVRPFGDKTCHSGDWYLVCKPELADSPKVRLFYKWLMNELESDKKTR